MMNYSEKADHFWREGYVKLGKILDVSETKIIQTVISSCEQMNERHKQIKTKYEGGAYPSFETIFVMDDVFTDNIFALTCRKHPILDFISYVFDDDAYLYHSKVPLKYPSMPGFKFHQDYYYWYEMGCLFPKMATCFFAIDESTIENGCLRFIPKSHLCGRINHVLYDGFSNSEADPKRVESLKQRYGEVLMELSPGDAVLFHCNLLHASEANTSKKSRIALLGCYNTKSNDPINSDWTHPHYKKQTRFHGKIGLEHLDALPDFDVSFRS